MLVSRCNRSHRIVCRSIHCSNTSRYKCTNSTCSERVPYTCSSNKCSNRYNNCSSSNSSSMPWRMQVCRRRSIIRPWRCRCKPPYRSQRHSRPRHSTLHLPQLRRRSPLRCRPRASRSYTSISLCPLAPPSARVAVPVATPGRMCRVPPRLPVLRRVVTSLVLFALRCFTLASA